MSFEDLLKPRPAPCRTCAFLEGLPKGIQKEVDVAMGKAGYTDSAIARALGSFDTDAYGEAPGISSVGSHREKGHRR